MGREGLDPRDLMIRNASPARRVPAETDLAAGERVPLARRP
jgi:hypothetical protein